MELIHGEGRRGPIVSLGVVSVALVVLAMTVLTNVPSTRAVPILTVLTALVLTHRYLFGWRVLLAAILVLVFFIPARYYLPGNLPFELDPYRLMMVLVIGGWIASLLADPRVRLRPTGFEAPLLTMLGVASVSALVNWHRVTSLNVSSDVTKSLTFLLSFVLVMYLIVGVVRTRGDLDFMLRVLVVCGSIVAAFAIFESVTGYNVFNHLSGSFSFLRSQPLGFGLTSVLNDRGGRARAYASAEVPIALGALLVMLIPIAVYLAVKHRDHRTRWMVAAGVLSLGSFATISRTSVVMLIVVVGVFVWYRPRQAVRMWPVLIPALLVIHVALPGVLGSLQNAFFPSGGIVAQQYGGAGTGGSGRLADVSPTLREWSQAPFLGEGYGTRITSGPHTNAIILDDQWLGTLLETGLIGVLCWTWLFGRVLGPLVRRARSDLSEDGLLCMALVAAILSYAVGMFTYDAFSFDQVTFILFVVMALSSVALTVTSRPAPKDSPA